MEFVVEQDDQAQVTERENVPPGIHEMEIRFAEEGPNSWKTSEDNPEGMCLKLRLALGNYRFVFDDLPQHLGWRAKQLASSLGVNPDGTALSLDPDSIVGKTVRVEIVEYTSKAGKISSVVKKYLPAAQGAPAKQPKQTKPRSAAVQITNDMSDDDLPF